MFKVRITWVEETKLGYKEKTLMGLIRRVPELGANLLLRTKKNIEIDFGEVIEHKGGLPTMLLRTNDAVYTLELVSNIDTKPQSVIFSFPIRGLKRESRSKEALHKVIADIRAKDKYKQAKHNITRHNTLKVIRGGLS